MFLSTLYFSISRSIDGGRAFSTLEIWSRVFQSRVFSVPILTVLLMLQFYVVKIFVVILQSPYIIYL